MLLDLDDAEVADELASLLMAAVDTTPGALAWTWYLLARHPDVEARVHEELNAVLNGRTPTARDLARVGQWMMEHASPWVRDIETGGDRVAWDAGSFVAYFPGMPIRYRSQWYILDGEAPLIFALGIHGQNLYIDRKNELVIAKLSSQALPLDAARIGLTIRAVSQLRKCLA